MKIGEDNLTLTTLKYVCINQETKCLFFNLKSSYMSFFLAITASFEYLCWSTDITNILIFQCADRLSTSEYDIYRCQMILTYKDGPNAKGIQAIYLCIFMYSILAMVYIITLGTR